MPASREGVPFLRCVLGILDQAYIDILILFSQVCFEIEGGDAKQRDRVGTAFSHGVLSNRNKYAFPILHTRSGDCQAPPNLLSNQVPSSHF